MDKQLQELEEELTEKQRRQFRNLIREYLDDNRVRVMDGFVQHGKTSTLEHCENVALISFLINEKLNLGANEKQLVENAMLHDYYLYDWHDHKGEGGLLGLHGFTHPELASQNARRDFNITEQQQDAIRAHMWPLTITQVPKDKEAVILCLADKYSTWIELMRNLEENSTRWIDELEKSGADWIHGNKK